jgi:hypothetical protein
MKLAALVCLGSLVLSSCASLESVSLTQIPMERTKRVTASVDKFIFLAFNFNNDYVDELSNKLKEQCTGGQVKGILTKDELTSYVIAHTRKITASGYCVK